MRHITLAVLTAVSLDGCRGTSSGPEMEHKIGPEGGNEKGPAKTGPFVSEIVRRESDDEKESGDGSEDEDEPRGNCEQKKS